MQILFGTLKTYFMLRIDHRFMTPEDCPKGSMCPPKRNIFDIYENIGFFITISPNYGSVGFLFLFFFYCILKLFSDSIFKNHISI